MSGTGYPFAAATCAAAAALLAVAPVGDVRAGAANDWVPLPYPPHAELDVAAETRGSYLIGNATAVSSSPSGGFLEVSGGAFTGTSTVNTWGAGVRSNAFIADPGYDGAISVRVGGSSVQQVVIDSVASLQRNDVTTIFSSPRRIADTRVPGQPVVAGGDTTVEVGDAFAGQFALLNLTIDRNDGPGFHALYPCSEGYLGTSSINVSGTGGAQAILALVKVDDGGRVCVRSQRDAVGIVVDFLGAIDSDAAASTRRVDTRRGGRSVEPGVEQRFVVGAPNSVFVGTIVSANPSERGWLAAYTEAGGYEGTSTLNSDGRNSVASFVMMRTDADGAIHLLTKSGPAGLRTDVVIDGTTIPELAPFLQPRSSRLRDTRQEPFVMTGDGVPGAELGDDPAQAVDALTRRFGRPTGDSGWVTLDMACDSLVLRWVGWDFGDLGSLVVQMLRPEVLSTRERVSAVWVGTETVDGTNEPVLDPLPAVQLPGGVRLGDSLDEILRRHPDASLQGSLHAHDIFFGEAGRPVAGRFTASSPRRLYDAWVGMWFPCGG